MGTWFRGGRFAGVKRAASLLTWPEKWWYGISAPEGLRFPDFLLIGAPRSGTSWLNWNMKAHPELFLPTKKELHYFDNHFGRPLRGYSRYFESAGGGLFAGESTPSYLYLSESRVKLIQRLMPDVRLIALLRNPVERAWSESVFRKVTRGTSPGTDRTDSELIRYALSEKNLRRGLYCYWLDRWLDYFPSSSLLVGFFEDIALRPQTVLQEVADHLAISRDGWDESRIREVRNPNKKVQCPDHVRVALEEFYEDEKMKLRSRFGHSVANWAAIGGQDS